MLNIRYVCLVNSVALCWFGIRGSPYSVHGICLIYAVYVQYTGCILGVCGIHLLGLCLGWYGIPYCCSLRVIA